jgi:ribosomal protein S18 acetylase RimI-like enzyme
MNNITFHEITDESELAILREQESTFQDFSYKYDNETIDFLKKNLNSENSLYLMAKQNTKFAAFASIDAEWWENNCFFLREIFVNPSFQKQKIGEQLVVKCISHARKNKATAIVTETAFENIPMQKLCKKLGFKKWDNPEWKDGITYKLRFAK